MALELTEKNFEGVLTKTNYVLLDFHASWCGPCKSLSPIIDSLSEENASNDNLLIGKVDVEQNREIATKYGIRSIPTIIFFKNGEPLERLTGFVSKAELQKKIDSLN